MRSNIWAGMRMKTTAAAQILKDHDVLLSIPDPEHSASAETNEMSKEFDDFVRASRVTWASKDDNVPIIPDLVEETAEELTRQVAAMPILGASSAHHARDFCRPGNARSSGSSSSYSSRALQQLVSPEETVTLVPLMT